MRCKFNAKDAALKLHETICRYRGEPVWVQTDGAALMLSPLTDRGRHTHIIKSNDEEFDISSVPLGYMNSWGRNKTVHYLTRRPIRRTRQGLCIQAVSARRLSMTGTTKDSFQGGGYCAELMFSQGMIDMIMGKYPTLGQALATLREDCKKNEKSCSEIAISREIALGINELGIINVFYRDELVGWIQPGKSVVHVPHNERAWVVSKFLSGELGWVVD